MDSDPYVSAVVWLDPASSSDAPGTVTDDPGSVISQAAAMLGGAGGAGAPAIEHHSAHQHVSPAAKASVMAQAKSYFTRAGFEVHAPLGSSFSIGGRKSQFEKFFGQPVVMDEEQLGTPVTTADGKPELPLEGLPPEVGAMVERISFPPPPDLGL